MGHQAPLGDLDGRVRHRAHDVDEGDLGRDREHRERQVVGSLEHRAGQPRARLGGEREAGEAALGEPLDVVQLALRGPGEAEPERHQELAALEPGVGSGISDTCVQVTRRPSSASPASAASPSRGSRTARQG